MTISEIIKLAGAIAVSFLAGGIGSLATIPNIPTWYVGLDKPPFLPPNEVFSPVWIMLYILIGMSLYLVTASKSEKSKTSAYIAFGIQLVLNALWPIVFFGLHLPLLGIFVIVALLASIIWMMIEFRKHTCAAMWLLLPYLLWICFATYLTVGVAVLN